MHADMLCGHSNGVIEGGIAYRKAKPLFYSVLSAGASLLPKYPLKDNNIFFTLFQQIDAHSQLNNYGVVIPRSEIQNTA